MRKSKRISLIICSFILCTLLFGCGEVRLKSQSEINSNGSGVLKIKIEYDNNVASSFENGIIDKDYIEQNGLTLDKYSKDNMNIEELTYNFGNLKELERKINSSKFATMVYSKKIGIINNVNNITLKFNQPIIEHQEIKKYYLDENNQTNTETYKYIKNMQFTNLIRLPGVILDSNATEEIDSNTKVWNYRLIQIDENTEIKATYQTKNTLIIPIVLVSIAILGYVLKKRRVENKKL